MEGDTPETTDEGEDGLTQEGLLMIAFLYSFFFTWNVSLSSRAVAVTHMTISTRTFPGWIVLESPVWICGMLAPVWICHIQFGLVASLGALLICVVMPYGVAILRSILLGPDAQLYYRDGTVEESRSLGWLGCLLGIPPTPPPRQLGESFNEHDILVITKAKKRSSDDAEELDESLRNDQTPKHDILLSHDEVCGICLEDYENGEDIAQSKNPSCRHVFHAGCLKEWLSTKEKALQVCPTCRESYHLLESESDGELSRDTPPSGTDGSLALRSSAAATDQTDISSVLRVEQREESSITDLELGSRPVASPQIPVPSPDNTTSNETESTRVGI